MEKQLAFFVFLMGVTLFSIAQENPNEPRVQEGQFTFDTDKPFTLLELEEKTEAPVVKKKKPKKKTFYGIKTKKGFTRKGYTPNITVELFYYLKKSEKPSGFARDIYWYDFTRREIRKTDKFDPEKGVLHHHLIYQYGSLAGVTATYQQAIICSGLLGAG